jgi:hypothetical protein
MSLVSRDNDIETISYDVFPKDYYKGHIGVIGSTGSGKTYYIKGMIKTMGDKFKSKDMLGDDGEIPVFVFVIELCVTDWKQKEKDGRHIIPEGHVFSDWNDEIRTFVTDNCKKAGRGIIIFDDFNKSGKIDFATDKSFGTMIRTFRHINVQIIAVGHTPNDLPVIVKDNLTHALIFGTNSMDIIEKISHSYMLNDTARTKKLISSVPPFGVLKINRIDRSCCVHTAKPPSKSGYTTSNDMNCLLDSDSDSDSGGSSSSSNGVYNSINIKQRDIKMHGGVYNDASVNNMNLNIQNDFKTAMKKTEASYYLKKKEAEYERELEIGRIKHNNNIKKMNHKNDVRNYLMDNNIMGEDLRDCCKKINMITGWDVAPDNIFKQHYDVQFMQIYFPACAYKPKGGLINSYGGIACALIGGNKLELAKELIPSIKQLGFFGNSSSPKISIKDILFNKIVYRKSNAWLYEQSDYYIKDLISIMRQISSNPELINSENISYKCFLFLHKYYHDKYFKSELKKHINYKDYSMWNKRDRLFVGSVFNIICDNEEFIKKNYKKLIDGYLNKL